MGSGNWGVNDRSWGIRHFGSLLLLFPSQAMMLNSKRESVRIEGEQSMLLIAGQKLPPSFRNICVSSQLIEAIYIQGYFSSLALELRAVLINVRL
jgi:hypothetical protein